MYFFPVVLYTSIHHFFSFKKARALWGVCRSYSWANSFLQFPFSILILHLILRQYLEAIILWFTLYFLQTQTLQQGFSQFYRKAGIDSILASSKEQDRPGTFDNVIHVFNVFAILYSLRLPWNPFYSSPSHLYQHSSGLWFLYFVFGHFLKL